MARRASKAYQAALKDVEKELGDTVLCDCGATLTTFPDKCVADLATGCRGFNKIDVVRSAAMRRHGVI